MRAVAIEVSRPLRGACSASLLAILAASCAETRSLGRETPLARHLRDLSRRGPIVVAHRGDSEAWPENTLPAFIAAARKGAPVVELDFHQTRDGALVCLHDRDLDRTTDVRDWTTRRGVKVSEVSLDRVKTLDAGAWKGSSFRGTGVPTLEESLRAIQERAVTMIEHKEGDPAKLVRLLRRMGIVDQVIVQSFDWEWLVAVHRLEPRLTIAALGSKDLTAKRLDGIRRTGAAMVHWNVRDLRAKDVERLHALGYLVCVYTVDDELSWLGALAGGVDAVTTNRPGEMREFLRGRGRK